MDVLVRFFAAGLAVSLSSLAAKRFGPTVGGMLLSFPFVIGSGLLFVAMSEKGDFRETALGLGVGVWVTVALLSQCLR